MTLVTEFLISLSGIPRPSLAAMNASGYPVALEARAEERDRRALTLGVDNNLVSNSLSVFYYRPTSMMQYS